MTTIPKNILKDLYNSKTKAFQVLMWILVNSDNDGVVSISLRSLSLHLNIGVQQVRTSIELLISLGLIRQNVTNTQVTQYSTCISVTYNDFQHSSNTVATQFQHSCNTDKRCKSASYNDKRHSSNTVVTHAPNSNNSSQHSSNTFSPSKSGSYSVEQHSSNTPEDNVPIYNISIDNINNNNIQDNILDIKDNKECEEKKEEKKEKRFVKPTVEQIAEYIREKEFSIDAQYFFDYYESVNWFRGKTKIKNWKLVVNTWAKKQNNSNYGTHSNNPDKAREERLQGYASVVQEFLSQCN